jgi:hypothetical protein
VSRSPLRSRSPTDSESVEPGPFGTEDPGAGKSSLNGGAIAGLVIGLLVLVVADELLFYWYRNRQKSLNPVSDSSSDPSGWTD